MHSSEKGRSGKNRTASKQLRPTQDVGLPLDQMTGALADMLSAGDDPYTAAEQDSLESIEADSSDSCEISPQTILEAMLFVGGIGQKALSSQEVARLMRGVSASEIDGLVRILNGNYAARRCPYHIISEGSGYRLQLRDEFARLRDQFYGRARRAQLSQAAIEVLAIVAYNDPLTADEINQLRGTPSGPVLGQLVRRELLRIERPQGRGQRGRYHVTPRFLSLFGLENLNDLPRSQELEQL